MVLSCDPPRHAFLIHFGKQQRKSVEVVKAKHSGATVELALNRQSVPQSLVAIHFVRHGFCLPFVSLKDRFSTDSFHFASGYRHNQYFSHFSYMPEGCHEWQPVPGLMILISEHHAKGSMPKGFMHLNVVDRPVLRGLVVDQEILKVDVDINEFIFEFGTDLLKDVSVTSCMS